MKSNSKIVREVLTGVIALGAMASSSAVYAAPDWAKGLSEIEKCGGVAKKGKNDCGTKDFVTKGKASHDCSGQAPQDNLPEEWVYTPTGVCDKIGGKVLKNKKL